MLLPVLALALHGGAVELQWNGDRACKQDVFQDSLEGYLRETGERRQVRAAVTVRREGPERWSATLVLATAEARRVRTLTGSSCAKVSEVAAFITAVVVDPGVLSRPRPEVAAGVTQESFGALVPAPPSPPGEVIDEAEGEVTEPVGEAQSFEPPAIEAPAEPAPEPAPELSRTLPGPLEQPPPRRRPAVTGFVRAMGGVEALGLPRVGAQASLAAGVFGRRWRIEVGGMYRAAGDQRSDIDPAVGARIRLWTIGARGCGVLRPRSLEVHLCGGLEAGQAIGRGLNFSGAKSDPIPWLAAVVGPALAWAPRRWLALWLGADLGVPLLRGTFIVRNLGDRPVFEIAPVSLRAAAGLELRFR